MLPLFPLGKVIGSVLVLAIFFFDTFFLEELLESIYGFGDDISSSGLSVQTDFFLMSSFCRSFPLL